MVCLVRCLTTDQRMGRKRARSRKGVEGLEKTFAMKLSGQSIFPVQLVRGEKKALCDPEFSVLALHYMQLYRLAGHFTSSCW